METQIPKFKLRGYSFVVTFTRPEGVTSGMAKLNINVHAPDAPDELSQSVAQFMGYMFTTEHMPDFIAASAGGKEKLFATYEYSLGPLITQSEGNDDDDDDDDDGEPMDEDPPAHKCEKCGEPSYGTLCDPCCQLEAEKAQRLANTPVCCARCEAKAFPIELVNSKAIGAAICIECLRATEPPTKTWQKEPITEKQSAMLEDHGMRPDFAAALSKGEASRYIGQIIRSDEAKVPAPAAPLPSPVPDPDPASQICAVCHRQTAIADLAEFGHVGRLVCRECREFMKQGKG